MLSDMDSYVKDLCLIQIQFIFIFSLLVSFFGSFDVFHLSQAWSES